MPAAERAGALGHALALEELARAGPAEVVEARAFLADMQELLRDATEMAARLG